MLKWHDGWAGGWVRVGHTVHAFLVKPSSCVRDGSEVVIRVSGDCTVLHCTALVIWGAGPALREAGPSRAKSAAGRLVRTGCRFSCRAMHCCLHGSVGQPLGACAPHATGHVRIFAVYCFCVLHAAVRGHVMSCHALMMAGGSSRQRRRERITITRAAARTLVSGWGWAPQDPAAALHALPACPRCWYCGS